MLWDKEGKKKAKVFGFGVCDHWIESSSTDLFHLSIYKLGLCFLVQLLGWLLVACGVLFVHILEFLVSF